jgi:ATP-dependent DNA helicase RecG
MTLAKPARLAYTWTMLTDPINLQHGPGPRLAFLPSPDPAALAAAAVALANTDGGAIVVGLRVAGGLVEGTPAPGAVEHALRRAAEQCAPPVLMDPPEQVAAPGGPLVVIRVPRGQRVHALHDGRVLVRTNLGANRFLNGDEIRRLVTGRETGAFEMEIVPGATRDDLDPVLVADFAAQRAARRPQVIPNGAGAEPDDLLRALEAVTASGEVTVAGLLLFGRDPQHWLPDSGARLVRQVGARVALDEAIGGALVPLLDRVWDGMVAQMRTRPGDDSIPLDYPVVALREALVNAVTHRDYRLRGERVTVRVRSDRVEITSPGGLPGFLITAEGAMTGSYSRNLRLATALRQWGRSVNDGRGLLRLITSLERAGGRPPEIETAPYRVTVHLHRSAGRDSGDESGPLTNRQQRAMDYVREHGSITLRELRTLCTGTRSDQLQRDLAALVAGGHLRKVGPRTAAYYILP